MTDEYHQRELVIPTRPRPSSRPTTPDPRFPSPAKVVNPSKLVPIRLPLPGRAAWGGQHRTPHVNSQSLPHLSAPASSYLSQLASLPPSPPQCKIDQELRCECGACRRERGRGREGRPIHGRKE
ncbi:hypothetical protein E2C01_009828 [Portunus trituberculatus]|uniref:Uncharacterized protein n=1 Tax=Portunus trituberculatus TaxID=210409 RepID=A0A5B7D6T7_PORTR|nr:hypothetical protein [Portunus trituberculatus]